MHLTYFNMKKILALFILPLFLVSCGSGDKQSIEAVIESQNIESIRTKKAELVSEQNLIKEDIKKLDIAIATLDAGKKIPLITTFELESTNPRMGASV